MQSVKREIWLPFFVALVVAGVVFFVGVFLNSEKKTSHILFETETNYYTMRIVEVETGLESTARIMYLDIDSHSVVFSNPEEGPILYTSLAPALALLVPSAEDIHVIGAGAYVLPSGFAEVLPDANISVTEIDPQVEQAAVDYFGLDTERITTIAKDARVYFANDNPSYDIVFGDAYNSFISVPWYLTTREFTELVKSRLTPNGMYAMNMIGSFEGESSKFFQSILKTFSSTFPNYYIFGFGNDPARSQNIVIVGMNGELPLSIDDFKKRLGESEVTRPFARFLVTNQDIDTSEGILLTDDFAPVENLMIPAMKEYFGPYLTSFRETIAERGVE